MFGVLGLIDCAFLAANGLKVAEGGWLPLLVAASLGGVSWVTGSVFFFVIGTWLWLFSYLLY